MSHTRNILAALALVVLLTACSHEETISPAPNYDAAPCPSTDASTSSSASSSTSSSTSSSASSTGSGAVHVQPSADCGNPSQYVNAPMILNGTMEYLTIGDVFPAGQGVRVPLLVSRGARITEIRVRVAPDVHSSIYGATLPSILLSRVGRDGVRHDLHARVADPFAEPGQLFGASGPDAAKAYAEVHDIVMELSEVADDSFYYLNVDAEGGGGQSKDGRICGVILTQ